MGYKTAQGFLGQPVIHVVCMWRHGVVFERGRHAHPLYRISSPQSLDFPLLIVRYPNCKLQMPTYEASSLSEISRGTTTHLPRVHSDVEVGFGVDILDLVNSWFQFSVLEDGRGVAGRVQSHGWQSKCGNAGERKLMSHVNTHARHAFVMRVCGMATVTTAVPKEC